jgi:hypothetical protein
MKQSTKYLIMTVTLVLLIYALGMAVLGAKAAQLEARTAHITEWACPKVETGRWYTYEPTGDLVIAQGQPVAGKVPVKLASGGQPASVACARLLKFGWQRRAGGYGT